MNTKLKARIEDAIDKVLENASENCDDLWQYYIHPEMARQMTNAAEAVFDSCQDGQKYYINEINC